MAENETQATEEQAGTQTENAGAASGANGAGGANGSTEEKAPRKFKMMTRLRRAVLAEAETQDAKEYSDEKAAEILRKFKELPASPENNQKIADAERAITVWDDKKRKRFFKRLKDAWEKQAVRRVEKAQRAVAKAEADKEKAAKKAQKEAEKAQKQKEKEAAEANKPTPSSEEAGQSSSHGATTEGAPKAQSDKPAPPKPPAPAPAAGKKPAPPPPPKPGQKQVCAISLTMKNDPADLNKLKEEVQLLIGGSATVTEVAKPKAGLVHLKLEYTGALATMYENVKKHKDVASCATKPVGEFGQVTVADKR